MTPTDRENLLELERRHEALSERMQALLGAHPDIIFRLDGDARILDFHAADPGMLAFAPDKFLGRKVEAVFEPDFAAKARSLIRRALESNETQTWEYSLDIRGRTLLFESRIVPSGPHEVLSIVRDITKQRHDAERVRLTEARLKHAQEVARIGSWERDLKAGVAWWSDETYRLLGLDRESAQASLKTFLERLDPEDVPYVVASMTKAIEERKPYVANHRVILPDGTRKILSSRAEVVVDGDGNPVRLVGTIQDVTERVELEREILALGERERERVARDLHDGLGQTLTGISLSLKALVRRLERGEDVPVDALRRIEQHVQEAMNETRRATRLLSPRMEGLRPALEGLVRQLDHDALSCTIHGRTRHDVHDSEIEMHLYRIAQEAVSNAVRHSRARHMALHYRCDGHTIELEVLDDGIGLSSGRAAESRADGVGLRNMRYRAHMIGGSLDVTCRDGGGTRVYCSCPCRCGSRADANGAGVRDPSTLGSQPIRL